jgi:hypothetical protein
MSKIVERNIKIEVFNFTEFDGYLNCQKINILKQDGKEAIIQFPSIQTLKLTEKQESLLLQFINSL